MVFRLVRLALSCAAFFVVAKGSTNTMVNILDFYPAAEGDGLKIIWAHAVNSQADLTTALTDDTMMLEADVSPEENTGTPIMAHPPDLTSDVTLSEWINRTTETNKGMKLDIKYIEVLADALDVVKEYDDEIHQPLWYNADIVAGPNSPKEPVDPVEFISTINDVYPGAVLSLGWTTAWEAQSPVQLYTWTMIFDNLNYSYPCEQAVTFPVRAVWAASSWDKWVWMLGIRDDFSLSVWSSSSDDVDVNGLVTLRQNGDMKRIYYDIPEAQMQEFKEALESVSDRTVESEDVLGWDKTQWHSIESKSTGDYIYLSTYGAALVGESRRSLIQSKTKYHIPSRDGEEPEITGRVQFVFRPNQDTYTDGDGIEIYFHTSGIDEMNAIIDGLRLYIGRNGRVILGFVDQNGPISDGAVSDQLSPSDCYSFDVTKDGSEVTAKVQPVECSDGTGSLPSDSDPVHMSLEISIADDQFYVAITKAGDQIDVLLEDITLPYSSATAIAPLIKILFFAAVFALRFTSL